MDGDAAEKELKRLKAIIRIHHSFGTNLKVEEIARIAARELIDLIGCSL